MALGIFAAYYPFDTLDVVSKLSHSDKLTQFEQRLKQASVNMGFVAANMRLPRWVGFFCVPEYYFLKRFETVDREQVIELYSESEMNALMGRMISLSDQYSRMVIMPGTISWRRALGRTVQVLRRGKPVDIKYDGISAAPVFYRGNQVCAYEKRMNDGNIDGYVAETRFRPGTESPLFEVENLNCGIEICGDFNEGNLAKVAGQQSLDFEFMMSGSNYHMFGKADMDKIPVRNGGYFLHVDQAPKKAPFYNGVWCVSRGRGWHGIDADALGGSQTDPWTMKPIRQDRFGVERSVGHVVNIANKPGTNLTSGLKMPGARSHSGIRLLGNAELTKALDSTTNAYEVTFTTELVHDAGSTSDLTGRSVSYKVRNAQIVRTAKTTDASGKSTAVVRCQRDQPATLIAEFHNAKAEIEVSVAWLGPGEVTKMGTLKGTPHESVLTFSTPV